MTDLTLSLMLSNLMMKYPDDAGDIRLAIWEARRLEGENEDLKNDLADLWVDITKDNT